MSSVFDGIRLAVATAQLRFEDASMLVEDRLEFLKQHYAAKPDFNTSHDPHAEHKIDFRPPEWGAGGGRPAPQEQVHKVVDFWAQHDPTPNKQYTGRVLHWYHQKNIRQEDYPRVRTALKDFHAFKSRMPEKDINRYPTLQHLESEVEKVKGGGVQTKSMQKSAEDETLDQFSKKIHSSPNVSVREIRSGGHPAMSIICRHTKWCTSSEGTFENYAKQGPFYWIHDKKQNQRYLYHPGSDQLMDEADRPADHHQLMQRMPELKAALHGKGYHFTDPERLHKEMQAGKQPEPNVKEWMARTTNHQELLTSLLPEHPAKVLGNKHFKNWSYVRKLLTAK